MVLELYDPEIERMAGELARRLGTDPATAERRALADALGKAGGFAEEKAPYVAKPNPDFVPWSDMTEEQREASRQKLRDLQAELAKYPKTGLKADKPFFDSLYGDE